MWCSLHKKKYAPIVTNTTECKADEKINGIHLLKEEEPVLKMDKPTCSKSVKNFVNHAIWAFQAYS